MMLMKKGQNNRGVTAIVATVLILAITIPTIVILWTAVIPYINNLLLVDMSSVHLEIVTSEGYTVYDESNYLLSVQVKRGSDEIDLENVYVVINIEGNSHSYLVEALESNTKRMYYFGEIRDKPNKISVYASIPLAKKGETSVGNHEVVGISDGDLDEDSIIAGGSWIYLPRDRIKTLNCIGLGDIEAAEGSYCLFGEDKLEGYCDSTGECIYGECVIASNCYRGKKCEVPSCSNEYTCSYPDASESCDEPTVVCGDNFLSDESCDGYLFGDRDCETVVGPGYFGDLKCDSDCGIDKSGCEFFDEEENIETVEFFFSGLGTINKPYMIYNCYQLQNMKYNLSSSYKLARNINCSITNEWNWFDGGVWSYSEGYYLGFEPIGCGRTGNSISDGFCGGRGYGQSFTGGLNGSGFEISGLFINRSGEDDVSLIGSLKEGGTLTNLGMVDSVIVGKNTVGGIAGGVDYPATVSNCYNIRGSVDGSSAVGGISGNVDGAIVSNCYNKGFVTGVSYVGGITGKVKSGGDVLNSYNKGFVTGVSYVGGIAGQVIDSGSTVSSSYYLSDSCPIFIDPMCKGELQMKNESTYTNWGFGTIWGIGGGDGYPWLI